MEAFEAIAQPKRSEMLRLLAAGERSAGELASRLLADVLPARLQELKQLAEEEETAHARRAQRN